MDKTVVGAVEKTLSHPISSKETVSRHHPATKPTTKTTASAKVRRRAGGISLVSISVAQARQQLVGCPPSACFQAPPGANLAGHPIDSKQETLSQEWSLDNSGANANPKCIRVSGTNRRYASLGCGSVAAVKDAMPNMGVQEVDVVKEVVVRTRATMRRRARAIFDPSLRQPGGDPRRGQQTERTRVYRSVARELRKRTSPKMWSLARR